MLKNKTGKEQLKIKLFTLLNVWNFPNKITCYPRVTDVPYFKKLFGSSEEEEVSGFFVLSHLWMRGYFRLSKG